jgi:superfamily I DNA/RNA helicase
MFRYFGPPGTGKTTTLINQVEKALGAGVLPNQIGFFSFTRKAAEEAPGS